MWLPGGARSELTSAEVSRSHDGRVKVSSRLPDSSSENSVKFRSVLVHKQRLFWVYGLVTESPNWYFFRIKIYLAYKAELEG